MGFGVGRAFYSIVVFGLCHFVIGVLSRDILMVQGLHNTQWHQRFISFSSLGLQNKNLFRSSKYYIWGTDLISFLKSDSDYLKKWAINKQYWWLKKNGGGGGSLLDSAWCFMCNAHCDTTCSGWMCMQWGRILHPYRRLLWFLPVPDRKWSREWADTIMRTRHSIQPRQMCVRLSWCVYLPFGMFSGYSLSGRCFMLCYR